MDGRIEPGDMILQVNDINFENMSNDEAVRVLREVVQKPGYALLNVFDYTQAIWVLLCFPSSSYIKKPYPL